MEIPETRYARSGDVNIAYQVVGEGPLDLVYVPPFTSNVELAWEDPRSARAYGRLASFARLILFDKRGTGCSDRVRAVPTLETRMDYPWGPTPEEVRATLAEMERGWGTREYMEKRFLGIAPSAADDEEARRRAVRFAVLSASPGAAVALYRMNRKIDVRDVLPAIRVPTLILHRAGDGPSGRATWPTGSPEPGSSSSRASTTTPGTARPTS